MVVETSRVRKVPVTLSFKASRDSIRYRVRSAKIRRLKTRFRLGSVKAPRSRKTPEGVNLIGYIRSEMGLGTISRGMAAAFTSALVPFNVINIEQGNIARHADYSWSHKEVRKSNYDITVVCMNPDNVFNLKLQVPPQLLGNRYVIASWFWELPELPDHWFQHFDFVDEVWAASSFIDQSVSGKATVPVVRIPPVVQTGSIGLISRSQLNVPEDRYVFLSMFDTNSVLQRKNPLGVITAFKNAFPADNNKTKLILKFNNPDFTQPIMQEVLRRIEDRQDILPIATVMSKDEVSSLMAISDCFVSLHRSEGFGLGPAEAMSLGKPAIVTNWSGNTDYMTSDNSIGIDYRLEKLGQDFGPYKAHQHWAEPDLEQASYWMKKLANEPELGKRIGIRGRDTIHSRYSPETVGTLIRQRLEEIRHNA